MGSYFWNTTFVWRDSVTHFQKAANSICAFLGEEAWILPKSFSLILNGIITLG